VLKFKRKFRRLKVNTHISNMTTYTYDLPSNHALLCYISSSNGNDNKKKATKEQK
jgi:hypothetical protein